MATVLVLCRSSLACRRGRACCQFCLRLSRVCLHTCPCPLFPRAARCLHGGRAVRLLTNEALSARCGVRGRRRGLRGSPCGYPRS
jgi:hypothetical protein